MIKIWAAFVSRLPRQKAKYIPRSTTCSMPQSLTTAKNPAMSLMFAISFSLQNALYPKTGHVRPERLCNIIRRSDRSICHVYSIESTQYNRDFLMGRVTSFYWVGWHRLGWLINSPNTTSFYINDTVSSI